MISFRSSRKLNSYLVSAKLYPLKITAGSCRFDSSRCQVCNNITETDEFIRSFKNNQYHQFKYLIVNDTLVSVIFIDKADAGYPVKWKHYWYHNLKAMPPNVFSTEDDW